MSIGRVCVIVCAYVRIECKCRCGHRLGREGRMRKGVEVYAYIYIDKKRGKERNKRGDRRVRGVREVKTKEVEDEEKDGGSKRKRRLVS